MHGRAGALMTGGGSGFVGVAGAPIVAKERNNRGVASHPSHASEWSRRSMTIAVTQIIVLAAVRISEAL